jgi:hypothetical protein
MTNSLALLTQGTYFSDSYPPAMLSYVGAPDGMASVFSENFKHQVNAQIYATVCTDQVDGPIENEFGYRRYT